MGSGIYHKHHCFTCVGDDDAGHENVGVYAQDRIHAEEIYRGVRRKLPLSVRYVKTLIVASVRHKQNRRERVALAG